MTAREVLDAEYEATLEAKADTVAISRRFADEIAGLLEEFARWLEEHSQYEEDDEERDRQENLPSYIERHYIPALRR